MLVPLCFHFLKHKLFLFFSPAITVQKFTPDCFRPFTLEDLVIKETQDLVTEQLNLPSFCVQT